MPTCGGSSSDVRMPDPSGGTGPVSGITDNPAQLDKLVYMRPPPVGSPNQGGRLTDEASLGRRIVSGLAKDLAQFDLRLIDQRTNQRLGQKHDPGMPGRTQAGIYIFEPQI